MTSRAKFIKQVSHKKLAAWSWDAMMLASSHDPDHAKELILLKNLIYAEVKLQDRRFSDICRRLSIIERQLERLGAPKYQIVYKGKKAA